MAKTKETEGSPESEEAKSAPPPEDSNCGNCANRRGSECHFMPPQVTSAVFAAWAPVTETDWCRQWEAK